MIALALGLVAGLAHVLSGPDHLAAVAPLSVRRGGWRMGFVWGVGHTSGVWVVGCAALLLQHLLPLARMASWSHRLAGGALLLIGLWTLAQVLRDHHRRAAPAAAGRRAPAMPGARTMLRAASLLGILHGLAGSSHYLGVLPAFAFGTPASSTAYLFGFGSATVAAMTACAWGLGRAAAFRGLLPALRGISGVAAVAVGGGWLLG